MAKRIAIFPAGRHALYTTNKYSAAVSSGGFLFVSGQVGSREDGSPEADPEKQLRLAFTNLNNVLAAAGCSFDAVVDFAIYVVDPEKNVPGRDEGQGRVLGRTALPHTDRYRGRLAVRLSFRAEGHGPVIRGIDVTR
jgi:enamine deaminase RidA (YjgF/YER057c/UK114 family)